MPEFFQTVMGKRFFEGTMPKVASSLSRIADALEKKDEWPLVFVVTSYDEDDMTETLDSVYNSVADAERELNKRHKGVDSTIQGEYSGDGSNIAFIYSYGGYDHVYRIYQFMVRKTK